jgi:RNA methyltransferase, TrmH family
MLVPARLSKLNPKHRMRKASALVMEAERRLLAGLGADRTETLGLAALLAGGEDLPPSVRAAADVLLRAAEPASGDDGYRRALNALRHELLAQTGVPQADWDLLDPHGGGLDGKRHSALIGTALYLEDIRSPFNVGTIFRSAEAFGIESLYLSPGCADPRHPRAERSGMGCVQVMPWERRELLTAEDLRDCFALELGGTDIDTFEFPRRGICVLGSEELGVRPETLAACGLGRVSIPLSGAKASLNVAVAAGILMERWARALTPCEERPKNRA